MREEANRDVPPGWSYDPSRWSPAGGRLTTEPVVSFSTIALWEATRAARWVNVVLAAWLAAAPLLLGWGPSATVNGIAVGVLLVLLAPPRGEPRHAFGGGWRAVWRRG